MLQTAAAVAASLPLLRLQLAAPPTPSALLRVLVPAWRRWLLPSLPSLPADRRRQCMLPLPECGMRRPSPLSGEGLAVGQQSLDASHIHTWNVHLATLPCTFHSLAPHTCAHMCTPRFVNSMGDSRVIQQKPLTRKASSLALMSPRLPGALSCRALSSAPAAVPAAAPAGTAGGCAATGGAALAPFGCASPGALSHRARFRARRRSCPSAPSLVLPSAMPSGT